MKANAASPAGRFGVLDSIRGIAAVFVLLSHFGNPPILGWVSREMAFWYPVKAVYGNAIAGVPAVIVFYVLSGFCIHYPHRGSAPLVVTSFFTRRFLRIGIPMVVAIGISIPMQINLSVFKGSVLWSLVAEMFYYALYPGIRMAAIRIGWPALVALSFGGSAIALAQYPDASDYAPYGNTWSWLLCLPSWLIGCLLADQISVGASPVSVSRNRLWFWRLAVWVWATLASALRFHSPIGYPWTLFFFGVPIFFWLRAELGGTSSPRIGRWLEWVGQWSYSIYLVHMLGIAVVAMLPLSTLPGLVRWGIGMAVILGLAHAFYHLIELPSHQLSRYAASKVGRPVKPA